LKQDDKANNNEDLMIDKENIFDNQVYFIFNPVLFCLRTLLFILLSQNILSVISEN